jgi:hypothetical protein
MITSSTKDGSPVETTPFDQEKRRELFTAGPLNQKLPIQFTDGPSWNQITGYCVRCKSAIEDNKLCGIVTETFKDIYLLEAVGYCPECKLSTCFKWNLNRHGISGRNAKGEWAQWTMQTEYWFTPLIEKLSKLFKRNDSK